ncbi:MAG TPA: class I SAM-dependent methyltransferase [Azospirillum sp.]|nr:class I SAM-dependent methyltransferase [Azospirillum sp.]
MFEESEFCLKFPSHQTALELFSAGWQSAFPAGSGLIAGAVDHFNDGRVPWGANVLGGLAGKSILELGPYEAYNTLQFEKCGASSVVSIEANTTNFFKCLCVKNIFNLKATFLVGDFTTYMESSKGRFDVCWASGVLYHMEDPLRLLRAMTAVSDTLFIWTQYYDDVHISGSPNEEMFFPDRNKVVKGLGGEDIVLHYRSYVVSRTGYFSGGAEEYSYWMKKDDIIRYISDLGYVKITMGIDAPQYANGPACFFIAQRE